MTIPVERGDDSPTDDSRSNDSFTAEPEGDDSRCADSTPADRIYLVGFMGAGKTTVGRLMARILGWVFLDLDREIESEAGVRIADIFANQGEGHFRRLERQQLAATLTRANVIVATGGGAYAFQENIDSIRQGKGISVWLEPPIDEILRRLAWSLQIRNQSLEQSQDEHQDPFVSGNEAIQPRKNVRPKLESEEQARALFEQRRPFYEQADLHIQIAASDSPKKTARRIVRLIFGTKNSP